jgi:hypothetical protein
MRRRVIAAHLSSSRTVRRGVVHVPGSRPDFVLGGRLGGQGAKGLVFTFVHDDRQANAPVFIIVKEDGIGAAWLSRRGRAAETKHVISRTERLAFSHGGDFDEAGQLFVIGRFSRAFERFVRRRGGKRRVDCRRKINAAASRQQGGAHRDGKPVASALHHLMVSINPAARCGSFRTITAGTLHRIETVVAGKLMLRAYWRSMRAKSTASPSIALRQESPFDHGQLTDIYRPTQSSGITIRKPFRPTPACANDLENGLGHIRSGDKTGRMIMNSNAVLENVRRYRAIASLYRQTAAFRPLQRLSLLGQAERWEQFAIAEMEAYFSARNRVEQDQAFYAPLAFGTNWNAMAAAA